MDKEEIRERIEAFRTSISNGKVTIDKVSTTVRGWAKAGHCTGEQAEIIISAVSR